MENSRIPNKLKKCRRITGYSQTEVAKLLGLNKTVNISRWETGLSLPSTIHLIQLCVLYKTNPEYLYREFWKESGNKIKALEKNLLTQQESLMSNEKYYL